MDCKSISFEPNLKFVLELKEDLKVKYYEQFEKAKQTLETFSYYLQDICHKHQKLLEENIELTVINEKLLQIFNKSEFKQQKIYTSNDIQSSQILSSSRNCNEIGITNKIKHCNKKIDNKSNEIVPITEKESTDVVESTHLSDFSFDNENMNFEKHNSSPPPIIYKIEKAQNSPILCKNKKGNLKKNNLSIPNFNNSKNNDSKSSSSNCTSTSEKHIEIESNSNEFLKIKENPLQLVESIQDKNDCNTILSVSKTHFGKSEFIKNGKRLRQTKLSLKKVLPMIDISKVECKENCKFENSKSKCRIEDISKEKIVHSKLISDNVNINLEKYNKNKMHNMLNITKESFKFKQNLTNHPTNKISEDTNNSIKNDDLVEISPGHNETSKLRNKLNLNKKCIRNKTAKKSLNVIKENKNFENSIKDNLIYKNKHKSFEKVSNPPFLKLHDLENNYIVPEKHKTFEHQKSFNDETFFSPVELVNNKINESICSIDSSEFEDKICETPPAKKMLLNSFDVIPGREPNSPDYAYQEAPVRNKNKKAELPGWCCRDCEKWYSHLPEEEKIKRKNQCSKHRGKYKADVLTPESFWNPGFDDDS